MNSPLFVIPSSAIKTPYSVEVFLFLSDARSYFNLPRFEFIHAKCECSLSVLTPKTSAFNALKSSYLSLKDLISVGQMNVKSSG